MLAWVEPLNGRVKQAVYMLKWKAWCVDVPFDILVKFVQFRSLHARIQVSFHYQYNSRMS